MPDEQNQNNSSSCGGCLGALFILGASAYIFISACPGQFSPVPGEMNLSVEALQKTFDEIDRILPDSLIIIEQPDPYMHYMSAESFGNLFYGLNPAIDVVAKADTSRKYKFQYVARVDHVDINEFKIRVMLIDSIWRTNTNNFDPTNPFSISPKE